MVGRPLGSPNCKELKWNFVIYEPTFKEGSCPKRVWSKKYSKIDEMSKDMVNVFTVTQLRSYAAKNRYCPKNIEIQRICEPVYKYGNESIDVSVPSIQQLK